MNALLADKVVLVTGAESGIGQAVACACAAAGARVCAAGLVEAALAETVAQIEAGGGVAIAVPTDIRSAQQIDDLFRRCAEHFGRIDGVVANAGVMSPPCPAQDLLIDEWKRVIDVNLTGTFLTVMAAARYLIAQGKGGSIIATGSSTAVRPISGFVGYIASKGGVHAMMQCLALELGPYRIRVNTLVPGQTATPPLLAMPGYIEKMAANLPLQEVAQPDEIGRYVAFALSDSVPHMTGAHLKVDSGRTIA